MVDVSTEVRAGLLWAGRPSAKMGRSLTDLSNAQRMSPFGGSLSISDLTALRTHTLSASNLAALSDARLSLKAALPIHSYNTPNTEGATSRVHFECLVKRYFRQLTVGCGMLSCANPFCFSSKNCRSFSPDVAATLSIFLASRPGQRLCDHLPEGSPPPVPRSAFLPSAERQTQTPRRYDNGGVPSTPGAAETNRAVAPRRPFLHMVFSSSPFAGIYHQPKLRGARSVPNMRVWIEGDENVVLSDSAFSCSDASADEGDNDEAIFGAADPNDHSGGCTSDSDSDFDGRLRPQFSGGLSLTHLTLPLLESAIGTYEVSGDATFLVSSIRTVFSSSESLNASFTVADASQLAQTAEVPLQTPAPLDMQAVRHAYKALLQLEPRSLFEGTLANATAILLSRLESSPPRSAAEARQLCIVLESPLLAQRATNEPLLRKFCAILCSLPPAPAEAFVALVSRFPAESMVRAVRMLQAHLSTRVHPTRLRDESLVAAVVAVGLLHDANERGKGIVPFSEFHNESICRKIDFKEEYAVWRKMKNGGHLWGRDNRPALILHNGFSFLDHPYLLDPAAKSRVMHIDAVVQMSRMFEDAFVRSAWVFQAQKMLADARRDIGLSSVLKEYTSLYLVLEVRRDHLIEDTLNQISHRRNDLKKPLKVKYVGGGEEGLDMGGVQKEYFQVIIDRIFDPEYDMFRYCDETRNFWINGRSLESDREFELVGVVLGLAIYNGINLDVHFPMVVYRKLLGHVPDMDDLRDAQPTLAKGLQALLDFDGDVEGVFCRTFRIEEDSFGVHRYVDLVPNGDDVPVTTENRGEFVRAYVKYLLGDSVRRQFAAFARGFHAVCGGDALRLCRPEELEMLVCGSPDLDFDALQRATQYDDGYHANHPVIRHFWSIVHGMSLESKRKLLVFVTGSDRVPIRGLSNLTFVIQRNGPDSDRLPTALTCFGRLLLPEYASREKLENRLVTAIENGKGFGLV
eukprot:Opistho-2@25178